MEGSWRGGGGTGMVFQFAAASGSGNIRRSAKTKKAPFTGAFFILSDTLLAAASRTGAY
ncbi:MULTISPECIES: hypothetical protein [Achromobacter]|uniref:hypothetical protein n=1 Tax=Achromobacter TaxID=222 RepID=UPI000AEC0255|nr:MULTISPECIES: hypothetical protein [Achromobacter]